MGYRDKLPPKPLVQFYAAAPVHILSAVDTENVVAAKQAGVDNYIVKPFNAETLKKKLVSVIGDF